MDVLGLIVIIGASIYATDVLRKKYNRTRHAQMRHQVVNTVTNQQQAQNQATGGAQGIGTQQTTTGNPQNHTGGGQTAGWRNFVTSLQFPKWLWAVIVAVIGFKIFGKDVPLTEVIQFIKEYWIPILLGVSAFYGLMQGSPAVKHWGTVAFVAIVLYWSYSKIPEIIKRERLGPDYEVVAEAERKARVAEALREATEKESGFSHESKVETDSSRVLSESKFSTISASDTEWSEPLRITGQHCFRYNVLKHNLPKALAQVSTIDKPNAWFDLNGVENISIAWVRYKSKGPGPTEIQHELRPIALCK